MNVEYPTEKINVYLYSRFLFLHNLWSNVFLINGCRMHQLLTHLFLGRFVITAAPRQRGRRAFESAWLEFRLWSFWSKPNKAPVVESGKKRGKTFGVMVWQWCQGNLPCYNGKNTSSFMVDFQGIARAYFKFKPWPFWGGDFLVPKPTPFWTLKENKIGALVVINWWTWGSKGPQYTWVGICWDLMNFVGHCCTILVQDVVKNMIRIAGPYNAPIRFLTKKHVYIFEGLWFVGWLIKCKRKWT